MKNVFIIVFALLVFWSIAVRFFGPSHESDLPIMHWVTDPNPIRVVQIERFAEWMEEQGNPAIDLRLDTSNSNSSKKIIQGVSGVGADLIDINTDEVSFFVRMGLLRDLTDEAAAMGFDTGHTYEALKDALVINGRQYAFPANVNVSGLIVNNEQFEKLGIPVPSGPWSIAEFEEQGRRYVLEANQGLPRQLYFFMSPVSDRMAILRSYGGSIYNETLTAPALNSPAYVQMLNTLKRWIDLGITPSNADIQSMATDSGYGGSGPQLFQSGNYAIMQMGRHAVILLRQVGDRELSVVPPPFEIFPNITIRGRVVGVYSGGRHTDLAPYYMSYLASEAYNKTVVDSGDGLPPVPSMAATENYREPEAFPNEWNFHKHFYDYATEIAIPSAISPYILPSLAGRIEKDAYDAVMANIRTPDDAAAIAAANIGREIEMTLREHPQLQEDYDLWAGRQQEIERLKASGEKIPAEWIRNPFHIAFYRKNGLLLESAEMPTVSAAATGL